MAKAEYADMIKTVSGALTKINKKDPHAADQKMVLATHRVAETTSKDCSRIYLRDRKCRAVLCWTLFCLAYLAAGFDGSGDGGDHQFAVGIYGREDHTLALDAHHLARREIGDIEYLFAHQHRRIGIALRDTA